jgi:hypothetical protein
LVLSLHDVFVLEYPQHSLRCICLNPITSRPQTHPLNTIKSGNSFTIFQEQIKTVEKHKMLAERRQERERRKTQEIGLLNLRPTEDIDDQKMKRDNSLPGLNKQNEGTVQP